MNEAVESGKQGTVAEKKGPRCLLYGCLFLFLAVVVLSAGGLFAGYWFIKGQVVKFTSDSPSELPVVEYTDEEVAAIESKVESFQKAAEIGEQPSDLVLTAADINALIAKNEDFRGKVYVSIEEGQVSGEVSIPTDSLPGGKGRYFNASAAFQVSLENGVLIVTLADASVKGEKVPQQFIDAMSQENLAKDLYKDPEVAKKLRGFETITVQDDRVIIIPKRTSDQVLDENDAAQMMGVKIEVEEDQESTEVERASDDRPPLPDPS